MRENQLDMWNHQNHSPTPAEVLPHNHANFIMESGNGELSYEDRVRKALDLKAYLNYLKELFAQNPSDSDSSEPEPDEHILNLNPQQPLPEPKIEEIKYPGISKAIHTLNLNLNENSSSSSRSIFKIEPMGVTENAAPSASNTALPLSSPFSTNSSDYSSSLLGFSSSDSSADEDDGDEDQKDSELTQISDLELRKFLDKPAQGLDSPEDILSILNSSRNCKSKFGKSKKRRHKLLRSTNRIPGLPLSKSTELSPNQNDKSELKLFRGEEDPPAPSNPTINVPIPEAPQTEVEPKIIQESASEHKAETENPAADNVKSFPNSIGQANEPAQMNLNLRAELGHKNERNLEADVKSEEDDDDSLSEYMSITANAAISLEPYFKFDTDEMSESPASSVNAPSSSVHSTSNLPCGEDRDKGSSSSESLVSRIRKSSPQQQAKLVEMMNLKRKRLYILTCKKDIAKTQRSRSNTHKEMLIIKKRLAQACSKHLRQKALQLQKLAKESVGRAKKLTREMQAYWKVADRAEKENRRRKDREVEERRKTDMELLEAKRQQRKLNFLITQTELYAHFMSKKLGVALPGRDESVIMNQLDESRSPRLAAIDDYDSEEMKKKVRQNVDIALKNHKAKASQFNSDLDSFKNELRLEPDSTKGAQFPQPKMFVGTLKHYQLRGMNWLVNLFSQGINGILADEMGLGKTVQSIAFFAHIAESYDIWGPFLVIGPASTLHNWQQEFQRFVPELTVVPYWGNPQERKILRQCWQHSGIHSKDTSFHVVVTSYQIVVTDIKYFNRFKWQYMLLDEAQAIKSTTSARWKSLLGFNCRNRLLLTGTPIQNTMGELWALLHFVMPSLFDSHDEFNEWFSKDIEAHAENRNFIDEKHLCRLHMILKPFMLRRIKKDVENELSDKIEILKYCPLTSRQLNFYMGIKKKIRIEELIKSSTNSNTSVHETTNLMNLVMQFRKVCNHPDLFEKREVESPFFVKRAVDVYPKLLYREGLLHLSLPSKRRLLENDLSIFNPIRIHEALFRRQKPQSVQDLSINSHLSVHSEWSWMKFSDLSPAELNEIIYGGLLARWKHILESYRKQEQLHRIRRYGESASPGSLHLRHSDFLLDCDRATSFTSINDSEVLRNLVFVSLSSPAYALLDQKIYSMPETIEHRSLRSRKAFPAAMQQDQAQPLLPEFIHTSKEPSIRVLVPTPYPSFICQLCPKVSSGGREVHFHDQSAYWWLKSHELCSTPEGLSCTLTGTPKMERSYFSTNNPEGGILALSPHKGWSRLIIPDKEILVSDSGKLSVLDGLLKELKAGGHRVLIYSQMTKMITILEEFLSHRKWTYIRLDGSSKISDRRDMVADFQTRSDIFIFLLSTRAGGLGINLTAADTVIFYDIDWNPTVDQQAMDRAHRVGQTKQVTVYRLICKGTIEERILQRAKEKNEIQRMVISGESFRSGSDALKPREVVSLLLDDEELERKYRQKQAEKKAISDHIRNSEAKLNSGKRKLSLSPIKKVCPVKFLPVLKKHKSIELLQQEAGSIVASSLHGSGDFSPSQSEVLEEFCTEIEEFGSGNEDEDEIELSDTEESLVHDIDSVDGGPSTSTGIMDWTADTAYENDEGYCVVPKRPKKLGRGQGKRGRPPTRVRVVTTREYEDGMRPRGRPRIKPIGPANQGIRGRKPGRPPLSQKSDTLSSSLTPLTTSQSIFGFYSSPDLDAP